MSTARSLGFAAPSDVVLSHILFHNRTRVMTLPTRTRLLAGAGAALVIAVAGFTTLFGAGSFAQQAPTPAPATPGIATPAAPAAPGTAAPAEPGGGIVATIDGD